MRSARSFLLVLLLAAAPALAQQGHKEAAVESAVQAAKSAMACSDRSIPAQMESPLRVLLVSLPSRDGLERIVEVNPSFEHEAALGKAQIAALEGDVEEAASQIGKIPEGHLRGNAAEETAGLLVENGKAETAIKLAPKLSGSAQAHVYLVLASWAPASDKPARYKEFADKIDWSKMGPQGSPQGARMYAQHMQRMLEGFARLAGDRKGKSDAEAIDYLRPRPGDGMNYALCLWGRELVRDGRIDLARELAAKTPGGSGLELWASILRADAKAGREDALAADFESAREALSKTGKRSSPLEALAAGVTEVLLLGGKKDLARQWLVEIEASVDAAIQSEAPLMRERVERRVMWVYVPEMIRLHAWAGQEEVARGLLEKARTLKPAMRLPAGVEAPSLTPQAYRSMARGLTAAGQAEKARALSEQTGAVKPLVELGIAQGQADLAKGDSK
jgi:hypothetical protein